MTDPRRPHLVAAPDKFRGTASAADVAAAAGRAARAAGWTADEVPMADGGEGTLEVVGGAVHETVVTGPLGRPVAAEWRLLPATGAEGRPTAVIEMARAAGRALVPAPAADDPVRASTVGVGELVLAAVQAGAGRVVVGVGGSATTDGGWGAVEAIGSPDRLAGVDLLVAADVATPFRLAARRFGPQKGATAAQVRQLEHRLDRLAATYRDRFGVDVDRIDGAGAAGGLAGGLAALGASVVPGFDLLADVVGLDRRLDGADLVVTGEGRLDRSSFDGKVVGGVVRRVAGRVPVLCVVGEAAPTADPAASGTGPTFQLVVLADRVGPDRARTEAVALVEDVVADCLGRG
ncbi:MAG TPA: glycerate kinase [Acidimicrobiales bacterium]|nr:glycerate kinase [Acidimicrobiales bacterium]